MQHKYCVCLQSFGEHGRELITPEVGLRLLETLGQLGADMEQQDAASASAQHQLLRQTVFKVDTIPVSLLHVSESHVAYCCYIVR